MIKLILKRTVDEVDFLGMEIVGQRISNYILTSDKKNDVITRLIR